MSILNWTILWLQVSVKLTKAESNLSIISLVAIRGQSIESHSIKLRYNGIIWKKMGKIIRHDC